MKTKRKVKAFIEWHYGTEKPKIDILVRVKAQPIIGLKYIGISFDDRLKHYSENETKSFDLFCYSDVLELFKKLQLGMWAFGGGGPWEPIFEGTFMKDREIYITHEKDVSINPFRKLIKKTDKPICFIVGSKRFKTKEQALKEIERLLLKAKED